MVLVSVTILVPVIVRELAGGPEVAFPLEVPGKLEVCEVIVEL